MITCFEFSIAIYLHQNCSKFTHRDMKKSTFCILMKMLIMNDSNNKTVKVLWMRYTYLLIFQIDCKPHEPMLLYQKLEELQQELEGTRKQSME